MRCEPLVERGLCDIGVNDQNDLVALLDVEHREYRQGLNIRSRRAAGSTALSYSLLRGTRGRAPPAVFTICG
jgi:hypothetical protein